MAKVSEILMEMNMDTKQFNRQLEICENKAKSLKKSLEELSKIQVTMNINVLENDLKSKWWEFWK